MLAPDQMVYGLDGYLLAAHKVAANGQGCTQLVSKDVGVLCHHGPAAVQYGLGLGAQVALVDGGADDDTVCPIQALVELLHVILVDAAAALRMQWSQWMQKLRCLPRAGKYLVSGQCPNLDRIIKIKKLLPIPLMIS